MKSIAVIRILLLGLLAVHITGPVAAGFDDGVAAQGRGDYGVAMREFRWLAEQGHVGAHAAIGDLYRDGLGVPRDHAQAAQHYWWSAERGYCPAMFALARMYHLGRGVAVDYAAAARWYRAAARNGHAWAQFVLASFHEKGLFIPKDDVQAYVWYNALAMSPRQADDLANAARRRVAVAALEVIRRRMTSAQMAEAVQLVEAWKPDPASCERGASDRLRFGAGATRP